MRAAGARACARVLVIEPTSRKNIDMAISILNAISKKKKNGPGSRRKLVMKYSVELTRIALMILYLHRTVLAMLEQHVVMS